MASDSPTSRGITFVLWSVGLLAAVLLVFGVRYLTRDRIEVRTAEASYLDLASTVSTNGKVEPTDNFQANATVPGQIQDVYVDVGDKVKKGDLLIRMDDSEALHQIAANRSFLAGAESTLKQMEEGGTLDERNNLSGDLQRASLQREQAASDLAALKKLQTNGAASAGEVAAAQQRLDLAQSSEKSLQTHKSARYSADEIARAKAAVADGQAAVAAAQSALSNVVIRSPIAGTVYSVPVEQYDYARVGDDLVYVADLNRIKVTAYFDEPDIGKLAEGQPVKIVWEAKPNLVWHGHISQVPTTIIPYGVGRNVGECMITVDDARGDLLPNTNVTVTVTTAQHPHVLSIPHEALRTSPDGSQTYVYRIVNGRLARAPIVVGVVTPTRVEVRSGLAEHDAVVLVATNARDLTDGLEVTAVR